MNKEPDIDINNLIDEIEKEPELEEDDFDVSEERILDTRYDGIRSFFNLHRKPLLVIGLIVLFVIFIVAFCSQEESDRPQANLHTVIERVDDIETRLRNMEGILDRVTATEDVTITAGTEEATVRRNSTLTQKVEELEQKIESINRDIQAISTGTEETVTAGETQYHVVLHGESLYRIARKYGMTINELCRINNISRRRPIHPGQRLLVSPAKD